MRSVHPSHASVFALALATSAVAATLAAPAAPPAKPAGPATAGAAFFETKVRPVLVERCYSCHSSGSAPAQGGLKLDSREALIRGGVRGTALVPGDPERSSLIRALSHADKSLQMPPGGKLKPTEIAALTAWVRMGAPWPAGAAAPAVKPAAEKFWAWVPPKTPALPRVKNAGWARNPVDRFILAGLEAKGLSPAPPADRRTLIRRATFDLTGLPPTPAEIADFERECEAEGGQGPGARGQGARLPTPKAYARLIDRLLASPAYGERWGRHWLDVARYADSNGLDENLVFNNAWRYRDYVIRSINQDKPIDRFFQEQIAGDLLPPAPGDTDDYDRIVATGYLAVGPKMLAEDDPVKQEEDILDEQIDTFGKTFMGLTLGCARCHDHKFDPFPQTDYYALAGIFKSTRTMTKFTVVAEWQEVPLVTAAVREKLAAIEQAVREKRAAQAQLVKEAGAAVLAEARGKAAAYEQEARRLLSAPPMAAELRPVAGSPHGAAPAGAVVVEAEDFARGNVLKDREGYGKGIGVLVNAGKYPNETEYEVTVPAAGPYQLDLRYAAGDARPIRLFVNGALVASNAAGAVTGGFFPDQQQWRAEGVFRLTAGKNRIRFERASFFPHIDKLLLMYRPGAEYPRTPEQVAAETGLVPDFLAQAQAQLKTAGATSGSTLKLTLPENPRPLFPAETQATLAKLDEEAAALEKSKPESPRAMAVSEAKPVNVPVHLRGSYLTLGRDCPRGFPEILTRGDAPKIPSAQSGRRELAQWLTDPAHPLTSRVFVNRVWRWHFGRGIVPSTDNFGTLGDLPTNQPLLDWLASSFAAGAGSQGSGARAGAVDGTTGQRVNGGEPVNGLTGKRVNDSTRRRSGSSAGDPLSHSPIDPQGMGWSLKQLHRLIMLSNTYRMSSRYDAKAAAIDPENKLRWRMDRRRLEAEAIRDALFFVSGKLDRKMGGSLLNFKDRAYVTSTANADTVDYATPRRAVYVPVIRSALYDVYTAFDFGDPTVMNGDRPSTTVAPQALFVMNGKLVLENAKALAATLLARTEVDDSGRIRHAYETCYARPATPAEIGRARAFLARLDATYQATVPDPAQRRLRAWQSLCKSLMAASEFIYVD